MATWGSQTWGYYNWGTLGDASITVSGQSTLSLSVGSVQVQQVPGWGTQYWGAGEWGDLVSPEVALTGQQLNTNLDQVTISANADVTINTTSPNIELNSIVGNEVAGTSAEANPLGEELNSTVNSVFAGELVVVPVSSPSHDEWGTEYWGSGQWGVGDGITIALGQEIVTGEANVQVTGEQIAFQSVGTVEIPVVIDTGIGITSFVNDAFGGEVVEVQVTTASATQWGQAPYGEGQWGQGVGTDISQGGEEVATPSIEVPVTNTNLTLNPFANNQPYIYADANVFPTGQQLTLSLGNENAIPNTFAKPTGIQIGPFVIGDYLAGISAEVSPTGVTMSPTTGIIGLNAWAVVDPNSSTTWTVVDIAA